ncbi:MAG: hypothetical protein IKP21_06040 [Bacteroidales bacterium]|nr:hypothetical protein [Bacteroidales bacterium]
MKWIWLIVILVFSFMPSLMARKKNAQAAAADTQDAYDSGSSEEDEEDSFFNFDDVEAEEAAPAPEPYFTYEAPQAEVEHATSATMAVAEEEPAMPAFDLRSAIIYQTVLTNKYIA